MISFSQDGVGQKLIGMGRLQFLLRFTKIFQKSKVRESALIYGEQTGIWDASSSNISLVSVFSNRQG